MEKLVFFVKKYKFLLLIFLIALFLRLYHLETIPSSFHEDEVLNGYVGRFILKNGMDIYGNKWPPLFFNKFGDYYIIGPIYMAGLSTFLFGVNKFAVRFPAAIFGALTVFPIFFFARLLFKKRRMVAYLSALFLAILPWSVVLSRTTTEGVIGAFFFLSSITLLLYSLLNKKYRLISLLTSVIIMFFGYWIYHPYRVYPFLVMLPLSLYVIFRKKDFDLKYKVISILATVFFLSINIYIGTTPWGKGRFNQTSIFGKISGVSIRLQELIYGDGPNHILMARLFHNKLIGYTREFLHQYFRYFSFDFLFADSWGKSTYIVPEQGVIYLSMLIGGALGIILFLRKKFYKSELFGISILTYILLIAPLPASLTFIGSPNVHRSFFLSIPLVILCSLGLTELYRSKDRILKFTSYGLLALISLEFVYFIHQYSTHSDVWASMYRNDGEVKVARYLGKVHNRYRKVYVYSGNAISWYFLYFNNDFNKNYAKRFKLDSRINHTENIYYVEFSCPTNESMIQGQKDILVIDRPECKSNLDKFRVIKYIYGKNKLLKFKALVPKIDVR